MLSSPSLDQGRLFHSNSSSLVLLAWLPPGPPISLLNAGITGPHQAIFTWMGAGVENFGPHFFAANLLHTQLLLLLKKRKKKEKKRICSLHHRQTPELRAQESPEFFKLPVYTTPPS